MDTGQIDYANKPLSGLRVVDFSRVLAGPYCSMCLGDMGADVIKIERIDGGDDTRRFGPPFIDGTSTYFMAINRNKRSLAIDLKADGSRQIIDRLLQSADIVLENFRPGTMNKLGFDKERCWTVNPRLVYCSISAFGHRGDADWSKKPGYDLILQGMGGIPSITGSPEGPPSKVGASIADVVSGMNAFSGILLALLARTKTGQGQHVDISMQEGQLGLHTYLASAWLNAGVEPPRNGNRHLSIAPYSTYEAADGWLNIAVANEKLWGLFCGALGRSDWLSDARFSANANRVKHVDALDQSINDQLATATVAEWTHKLARAGIPAGPVFSIRQALEHPQVRARNALVQASMTNGLTFESVNSAFGIRSHSKSEAVSAPALGEHTNAILLESGFSEQEINAWFANKLIG